MVFQSYALFPHLTVADNVAFGLEMRKLAKAEIAARAREALRLVRLEASPTRLPRQLSGGQQQRVALARALAIRPDVLLLDEPLSNLDAKLREEVRVEIRELQRQLGLTTIMVTHDQEEALTVADRLVGDGRGRDPPDRHASATSTAPGRSLRRGLRRPQHFPRRPARSRQVRSRPPAGLINAAKAHPAQPRCCCGPSGCISAPRTGWTTPCRAGWNSSHIWARCWSAVRLSPADRVVVQLAEPRRCGAAVGDDVTVAWQRDAGMVFAQKPN